MFQYHLYKEVEVIDVPTAELLRDYFDEVDYSGGFSGRVLTEMELIEDIQAVANMAGVKLDPFTAVEIVSRIN